MNDDKPSFPVGIRQAGERNDSETAPFTPRDVCRGMRKQVYRKLFLDKNQDTSKITW